LDYEQNLKCDRKPKGIQKVLIDDLVDISKIEKGINKNIPLACLKYLQQT
jgi:hypothetical protein